MGCVRRLSECFVESNGGIVTQSLGLLQVEIAQAEGAKFVAHGATGKGNDQVMFRETKAWMVWMV